MTRRIILLVAALIVLPLALGGRADSFHNGFLPDCGGGVTSNCLVSMTFQNAAIPGNVGQIKLQWDSEPGSFFAMAWNTGGPVGQQHELGPTLTTASKVTVVVKPATTFSPTGVMSMANLESWGWNAATKELTVVGSPASGSWTNSPCNASPGGCSVNKADFDFGGVFMFSAFEIDPSAAPPEVASVAAAFKANLFGGHISTNAQVFTTPDYDAATHQLKFRVASAHCKASTPGATCDPPATPGFVNTGFFNAFVPNTFVQNIWGIAPSSLTAATAIVEGQGSGVASVTPVAATAISPAGIRISYSGFTFSAPNIAITPKSSADDAPVSVPESATAGPVNATRVVRVPQSGKFAVPVSISNASAKLSFPGGTALTVDGKSFGGMVFPPFSALESSGAYASVFNIGVSGIGTGREVKIDPPATLALPVLAGSDPSAYQPVAIDTSGGPAFLVGKVDGSTVTVQADRIRDGLNRFGLAKVPRPEVQTVPVAAPAVQAGFHSLWAGQSRSIDLKPGQMVDVAVKLVNTGTESWMRGVDGKEVRLGTSAPLDNTRDFERGVLLSPIVGQTRLATTAESVVQPGETGTFNVRLRAPLEPGTHQVFVRPVADGVTWMEDQGILVELNVK